MNVLAKLRKKVLLPNGQTRRGAISRMAERCGCSYNSMHNWTYGRGWPPGKVALSRIEDALRDAELVLDPRKPGPRGPRLRL